MVELAFGSLVGAFLLSVGRAVFLRTRERLIGLVDGRAEVAEGTGGPSRAGKSVGRWLSSSPRITAVGAGLIGAVFVGRLAGPVGVPLGTVLGASIPFSIARRTVRRRAEALERQLGDLVEAVALGVRSGLAVARALASAGEEAAPPLSGLLGRMMAEQALGTPLEVALRGFANALSTDDARLFVSVITVHSKSGGNLAGALDEVAQSIRHRMGVRRELRALSAQGRISGAVLGSLPIAFFLVLAATSHRELAPVYRSGPGVAMIATGLGLQALAFVWIRRLMKVRI
jgi:tight adherence protein B